MKNMLLQQLYKYLSGWIFWFRALTTPTLVGVGAVVESGGRLLLVRHSYVPGWRLSGGGVDRGEAPADAVLRELREEIGMTASDAPVFLAVASRKVGIVTNHTLMYFVGGVSFAFTPGLEILEARLCTPDTLPPGTTRTTQKWINIAIRQGCFPSGSQNA